MKKQWNTPTLEVLDVKGTFAGNGPPQGGNGNSSCKNKPELKPWCS